ncbi:hypothetical protein ETB97_004153 [Aspergillus alliaceus]|uniref:HNH nuclease domain-containing protein n=1 Tax=Petromyces alliaceus TaxID=209559 RepID=A0A8H6A9L7_PETAA|nr:hypothetical protein ETB97_004153 [Aspergillus burnettii]
MATAHRRHQLSLSRFIHPPRPPPLTLEESHAAQGLFKTLIDYAPELSRKFDRAEAKERLEKNENSRDDDGILLKNQRSDQFEYLEVAHIIPHSLATVTSEESELSDSKKAALHFLNMFDPDISPLIAGPDIDNPYNALTLTHNYHRLFGEFEIYFKQKDPENDRIYIIDSTEQRPFLRDALFPVTRELNLSPELDVDPPARKLLEVHCAIAHILKLSGADDYIEKTLREMAETCVNADGSTDIGRLIRLRFRNRSNILAVF